MSANSNPSAPGEPPPATPASLLQAARDGNHERALPPTDWEAAAPSVERPGQGYVLDLNDALFDAPVIRRADGTYVCQFRANKFNEKPNAFTNHDEAKRVLALLNGATPDPASASQGEALLSSLPQREWQPIATIDRALLTNGKPVLCVTADGSQRFLRFDPRSGGVWWHENGNVYEPTHFYVLPAPPVDTEPT